MAGPDKKLSEQAITVLLNNGRFYIILPDGLGGFLSFQVTWDTIQQMLMSKADYDPTGVAADVFDSLNSKYDPLVSGLTATDVQNAIDELAALIVGTTGPTLTVDLITTVDGISSSAGTIYPAGTQLEDIWRAELAPYVPPEFNALNINLTPEPANYEVGQTATVDEAVLTGDNDSNGAPAQNIVINGPGFDKAGIIGTTPADPATTVQKITDESQSWSADGEDADTNPIPSVNFSKNWYFRHYFGANSTVLTTGSTDPQVQAVIDALGDTALLPGKNRSVTCGAANETAGNYTYIAYAAKYGALTNVILNSAAPILGAFEDLGTFNITNTHGITELFRVYKSNADAAFVNGDTLDLS